MFQDFGGGMHHVTNRIEWLPIVVDFKQELNGEDHDVKIHEWFRVGNWMSKKNITITKWGEEDFGMISKWHLIGCLPTSVMYNNPEVSAGEGWNLSVNFNYDHANLTL